MLLVILSEGRDVGDYGADGDGNQGIPFDSIRLLVRRVAQH